MLPQMKFLRFLCFKGRLNKSKHNGVKKIQIFADGAGFSLIVRVNQTLHFLLRVFERTALGTGRRTHVSLMVVL